MSPAITINVTPAGVMALRDKLPKLIDKALRTATRRIQKEVQAITPQRKRTWEPSGGLRRDFKAWHIREGIQLEWPSKHAKVADEGAFMHIIEPKDPKGVLHWFDPQERFAKRVVHPGFKGLGFVRVARELALNILMEELLVLELLSG